MRERPIKLGENSTTTLVSGMRAIERTTSACRGARRSVVRCDQTEHAMRSESNGAEFPRAWPASMSHQAGQAGQVSQTRRNSRTRNRDILCSIPCFPETRTEIHNSGQCMSLENLCIHGSTGPTLFQNSPASLAAYFRVRRRIELSARVRPEPKRPLAGLSSTGTLETLKRSYVC